MPFNHVMIDLETFGVTPDSAIITIGAVQFNPDTGELGSEYYRRIDWRKQEGSRFFDKETVDWWKKQSVEAIAEIVDTPRHDLKDILVEFCTWIPSYSFPWGNGACFDIVILENAMTQYGIHYPWKYWNIRDVRTICDVANVSLKEFERDGDHHNSLDDAIHQAKIVSMLWQKLRK